MDKFYNQFFGANEYPPDKKQPRPESTGSDELDSTVDDHASNVGGSSGTNNNPPANNNKYQTLQSLNLGPPPLDGGPNTRKARHNSTNDTSTLSPSTPQYHTQKGKTDPHDAYPRSPATDMWPPTYEDTFNSPKDNGRADQDPKQKSEPRETYLRADDEDGFIRPKLKIPDASTWPPNSDSADMKEKDGDYSEKPRYPRITYNEYDRKQPYRYPDSPPPLPNGKPSRPPEDQYDGPGPSPGVYRERPDVPMSPPGRRRDLSPGRGPPSPGYDEKRPYGPPGAPGPPGPPGPPGGPGGRRANMRKLRDEGLNRMRELIMPYIGKWAQLSRSWASQTVIMLIFMGIGFILMAALARRMAEDSVSLLNAACHGVESASNAVINAPNNAALSTLRMVERSAENIIEFAAKTVSKILDVFQYMIVWVLKLYIGTYICFAELIIRTALSMVTQVGKIITDELNKAIDGVVGTLQDFTAKIADGANDAINDIGNFFNGGGDNDDSDKDTIDTDSIRKKLSVTIPDDWVNSIKSLEDKIPTGDQIFGNITELLDIPFNIIRNALNGSLDGVNIDLVGKVDLNTDKESNVCIHPMGQDLLKEVGEGAAFIMFIAGIALVAAGAGLIVFKGAMAWYRESRFRTRLGEFREKIADYKPPFDRRDIFNKPATREEMDLFILPGHPWLDRLTQWIVKKFGDNERTAAWRWWLHYVWHPPAMACFIAGLFGLIAIIVQIQAIESLRREYIPKMSRQLAEFQYYAIDQGVLGSVHNDSANLADDVNGNINGTEDELSNSLFGPVTEGTASLNKTLDDFVSKYISGIRDVFGDTPLQEPIEGLVNCTLTKNIQSIQKVLTYVNDFTKGINLPRVEQDMLYSSVKSLLKPLNATADELRILAVGVYVPDADELDPDSFLPEADLETLLAAAESKLSSVNSSELTDDESESDEDEESETDEDDESEESEESEESSGSDSSENNGNENLRKRQEENKDGESDTASEESSESDDSNKSEESESADNSDSVTSESDSELDSLESESELDSLDSESESGFSFSYDTVPLSELSREEVEDAQKFDGYTGGLIGRLCDAYISHLKGQIPLMIVLMLVWIVIAIIGGVKVAKDYARIKQYNLR
ncbi:plasma membrane fusion protein prm1 [Coemansia guatemalensis]|uniref:Plasma membrane fusion protein PRM1 n=1 Tax=Coemansia guatemalensis TaxID=2761395 RepID=A0A9W8I302_9FUNG|nr:plasma membrane fusion protein prm1 [Coemansia guatemalensis]